MPKIKRLSVKRDFIPSPRYQAEIRYHALEFLGERGRKEAKSFTNKINYKLELIAQDPLTFTKIYIYNPRSRIRWIQLRKEKFNIFYSYAKSTHTVLIHSLWKWGQRETSIPGYNKKYDLNRKLKELTSSLDGAIRRSSAKLQKMQATQKRKSKTILD